MRPLHERFLDVVSTERGRLASRRRFVGGSAKLAGGAGLALAMGGLPVVRAHTVAAQEFEDDLDIANYALTLEHLEYAFYRDGLELFDEAAFEDANLRPDLRGRLEVIRDHEGAHVDFLTETISGAGGEPVEEQEYDFGYGDDLRAFIEVAMVLENVGVSAYAGAAPSISDPGILAAALGVHSVEARHAAYLNERNGELAFPDAVDAARTREEVLELATPFIVS